MFAEYGNVERNKTKKSRGESSEQAGTGHKTISGVFLTLYLLQLPSSDPCSQVGFNTNLYIYWGNIFSRVGNMVSNNLYLTTKSQSQVILYGLQQTYVF